MNLPLRPYTLTYDWRWPCNWSYYRKDLRLLNLSKQTKKIKSKSLSFDEEEEISPPDDLKDNKEVQPKPKVHACNKCEKSFSKVSLLNRHMKLHQGIKPYQCNVCNTWERSYLIIPRKKSAFVQGSVGKGELWGELNENFPYVKDDGN